MIKVSKKQLEESKAFVAAIRQFGTIRKKEADKFFNGDYSVGSQIHFQDRGTSSGKIIEGYYLVIANE